ncbi:MAG TPA: hypothetical protein VM684_14740, partial [Gaiellales bacterium]|nr:hypothetical protein [Gaiellales bacterium]
VSLTPGGASSIVTQGLPCAGARVVAALWARLADRPGPVPAHARNEACTVEARVYDLSVVHCQAGPIDVGFVWRSPAA